MKSQLIFITSLFFLLALSSPGTGATYDQIDRCVAAIDSIKSCDVMVITELLQYPDSRDLKKSENAPIVAFAETNRDVFAVGLGRRLEQCVGNEQQYKISVKDWNAAMANGRPSASAFMLTGEFYYDYVNPRAGDFFLTDLLRDEHSTISPIKSEPSDLKLTGFQIDNPKLYSDYTVMSRSRGTVKFRGSIRVWLDTEHGYMPGKIEGYRQDKGQLVLTDRMVVEKFIQLDNGSWVPAKATMNLIDDNGRAWTGNSMELDAEHSSWNSIKSDELFLAKSLPEVNHELVGWKQYYSPALLAAEKGADDFLKEADRKEHRRNLTIGIVFLAVSLFTSLSIIIYMASRRGQKPNM